MNRKNVIILILITAIFGAIIYTLMQKNPEVEKIIISENNLITEEEIRDYSQNDPEFDPAGQIYAIMLVKNITADSVIDMKWKIKENGAEEIIQENRINVKNKGSGSIVVSLIQKDKSNRPGDYIVYIIFKDQQLTATFKISKT